MYEVAKNFALEVAAKSLDGRRVSKKSPIDIDRVDELVSAAQSAISKRYRETAPKVNFQKQTS